MVPHHDPSGEMARGRLCANQHTPNCYVGFENSTRGFPFSSFSSHAASTPPLSTARDEDAAAIFACRHSVDECRYGGF